MLLETGEDGAAIGFIIIGAATTLTTGRVSMGQQQMQGKISTPISHDFQPQYWTVPTAMGMGDITTDIAGEVRGKEVRAELRQATGTSAATRPERAGRRTSAAGPDPAQPALRKAACAARRGRKLQEEVATALAPQLPHARIAPRRRASSADPEKALPAPREAACAARRGAVSGQADQTECWQYMLGWQGREAARGICRQARAAGRQRTCGLVRGRGRPGTRQKVRCRR